MYSERSDAWLLRTSLTESPVFDIIVDRYYDEIFAYLARAVGWHPAADLAQQVFLVAFENRRVFKGNDSARPWLYGIARNIQRRWYRTEGRRRRADGRLSGQAVATLEFAEEADGRASAEMVRKELRVALMTLPRREREVFMLFALGGLSYSEVAEVMGTPVGTVRSRIHRARGRLRGYLENVVGRDFDRRAPIDG